MFHKCEHGHVKHMRKYDKDTGIETNSLKLSSIHAVMDMLAETFNSSY